MPIQRYGPQPGGQWGWGPEKFAPTELEYLSRSAGSDPSGAAVPAALFGLVFLAGGYAVTGWAPLDQLAAARDLRHVVVGAIAETGATFAGVAAMIVGLVLVLCAAVAGSR